MNRALASLVALLALAPAAEGKVRLDYSFAYGDGWRVVGFGGHDSGAQEVLRTRNGKLLIGGYSGAGLGFARLHPSGRLDRRFHHDGRATVRKPVGDSGLSGMAEDSRGRILAAVFYANYFKPAGEVAILRLRPGGRLDTGYGTGGVTRIAIPGVPESVATAGMAALPGGAALLVAQTRIPDGGLRMAVVHVDSSGVAGEPVLHELDDHHVVGVVRLPDGSFVVAANRYDEPSPRALLIGMAADGTLQPDRRVAVPGATVDDLVRDGNGVAALLTTRDRRWGVRRYTSALVPRRAPAKLPSGGAPNALAMDRRHRAWVAFDGGRVARVRPDGRPDRRFAPPRGKTTPFTDGYILSGDDIITHPRGGAVAVGRAHQDFDIREDYGPSRMWIARFF